MLLDFEDRDEGGFFFTADDHESLLARPKDPFDNALPSGNSMAILDLIALHQATGESSYLDHAGKAIDAVSSLLSQNPAALPLTLVGLQLYLDAAPDRSIIPKPLAPGTLAEAPAQVVTASARLADEKAAAIAPGSEFNAVRYRHDSEWLAHLCQSNRCPRAETDDLGPSPPARSIRDLGQGFLSDR